MSKTLLFLKSTVLILSLLTFAHACKKTANYSIEGSYNLKAEQSINLPKDGENILTVNNFTDSRCPINADCVWQGAAAVKVALTIAGKTENLVLCKGGCDITKQATLHEFVVNGTTYTIELAGLTPYPEMDKTNAKQVAELLIKRK